MGVCVEATITAAELARALRTACSALIAKPAPGEDPCAGITYSPPSGRSPAGACDPTIALTAETSPCPSQPPAVVHVTTTCIPGTPNIQGYCAPPPGVGPGGPIPVASIRERILGSPKIRERAARVGAPLPNRRRLQSSSISRELYLLPTFANREPLTVTRNVLAMVTWANPVSRQSWMLVESR
jgi:hypothetical protein